MTARFKLDACLWDVDDVLWALTEFIQCVMESHVEPSLPFA